MLATIFTSISPKEMFNVAIIKYSFICFFVLFTSTIIGQELLENKIDESTKTKIVRTTWERIPQGAKLYAYFRLSQINGNSYLEMKYFTSSSVAQNADINFLFMDNEELSLKNMKDEVSCNGCGATGLIGSKAPGIYITMALSENDIKKFAIKKIKKIAVHENNQSVQGEVKDKRAEVFQKLFQLSYPELLATVPK